MALYETFGEFDSAKELNMAAANQKKEGDKVALVALAKENGIDEDDATDFFEGNVPELCSELMAAEGKIRVEKEYLGLTEALEDYADWIVKECMEDKELCKAVRKKGKSLAGALGAVLKKAWEIKEDIHEDILKAAGIHATVKNGSPGMRTTTKLMREYYLGGNQDAKKE